MIDGDAAHIRNFKDFLLLYNQISESCFRRCTNTFLTRDVTAEESFCVNNCVDKHVHANHRIMKTYMEVQPILIRKRMEEMNSAQEALEAQSKTEEQTEQQTEQAA